MVHKVEPQILQNCNPPPCLPTYDVNEFCPDSHSNCYGFTSAQAEACALKAFLQREQ